MSDEPEGGLPERSGQSEPGAQQAEAGAERAEIFHADGSREAVEIQSERYWSGVLPRPEDFARFGEVVPDAPDRLLKMAEKEQVHRIAMEASIVPANQSAGRRGQFMGAAVSLTALVLAAGTAVLGAPWQVSVALVAAPVLSVARSLVAAIRQGGD